MQIVINISEDWEKHIESMSDSEIAEYLYGVIRNNGTPLPEGHGRLIIEKDGEMHEESQREKFL